MSHSAHSAGDPLPPSLALHVERAQHDFEEAWKAGGRPRIEDHLAAAPEAARPVLFARLLAAELAHRSELGEKPTADDYLVRFPGYADRIAAAFGKLTASFPIETRADASRRTPSAPPAAPAADPSTVPMAGPPKPLPPLLPKVPGYDVLEFLKEGGMGVVYRARQLSLNRTVALKMIRARKLVEPQNLARFHVEAEAVARLDHPHVVQIYDFGEYEDLPYFAMEFMPGGSLAERIAGRPQPPEGAARLVETLARAVDHLHRCGIVHRDLKPHNVLLAADGTPKVADFGLAKLLDADGAHGVHSVSGIAMGTPSYMAPEQAAGRTKDIGPPADVWALGAILYECLTGRPPFLGETPELTRMQVVTEEPAPPSHLRPDVPRDLEAVCLHCLEKDPKKRYAAALDLAEDLRRVVAGEPVSVEPLDVWEWRARWAQRAGFEILDVLTCGVRDVVYKARETRLGHLLALKVLPNLGPCSPAETERLRTEAQVLAKLQHPNIVRLYSFGELNGRPYFSLEYVDGGDLIEKFVDRPVAPAEAARLVEALARAIHYAHQQGVVHCALKPSNVLLTKDGVPKITNFGLNVLLEKEGDAGLRRKVYRRLASYLSPELAEGRIKDVGLAADVYALGAILYKLLTGGPPFLADTVRATFEQVCARAPAPPSHVEPAVPRALDAICLHCLEKDPRRRPASAEELAESLRRFLARRETDPDVDLLPGYEILEELGRGGLGVVHRARHLGLDLPVALKIFYRLRPERVARIRAATHAVALLHHANILRVYDCGECDGVLYAAEELVEGSSLAAKADGTLPPARAARLVETVAGAVHHAHERGIVHRNLKPRVVLLTADGQPKISSFETARLLGQAAEGEEEGTLAGTPIYMAPEQIAGDVAQVGRATDVYALGAILYELLTGRPPFSWEDLNVVEVREQWPSAREAAEQLMRVRERVRSAVPEPPRAVRAAVGLDLDAICRKCLEKEPERRYASALALADDLKRFREGYPVEARPVGLWERSAKWLRRRWRTAE